MEDEEQLEKKAVSKEQSAVYVWKVAIVEPMNKGHIGASHFVLYREVVCSSEVQNV